MASIPAELPRLRKTDGAWELLVDGKPYLILGAELQNSSMSSARYMNTVWQELANMGVNTVLGSVGWEDIEPEEGRFDFTELDAVLDGARAHGLRIIILWFASFKNGRSSYMPAWAKKNNKRFPQMKLRQRDGTLRVSEAASIFRPEGAEADARAFASLMEHLCETDTERTVIMVQVQNEVGLLGDSRDRSATAEKVFKSPVPTELVDFLLGEWDALRPELRKNLTPLRKKINSFKGHSMVWSWEECFGASVYTDEIFMAYHFARYLEMVAIAGRKAYDIPSFTNVWLRWPGDPDSPDSMVSGGENPGQYPSGGGVINVLDIWQRFASTLDFIAPDIYTNNYSEVCDAYCHRGQALFIPEQRRDEHGARAAWSAIGTYGALGVSPFAIDTIGADACPFTMHYRLMGSVASYILDARTRPGSIFGFFFHELESDSSNPTPQFVKQLGDYNLTISRAYVSGKAGPGFGIIIALKPDRFLVVGMGFRVEFQSTSPTSAFTSILRYEEKSVVDPVAGTLRTVRILNGDESRGGKWVNMPNSNPDLGESKVPITIPARTMIAEVEVYSIDEEVADLF